MFVGIGFFKGFFYQVDFYLVCLVYMFVMESENKLKMLFLVVIFKNLICNWEIQG